MSNLSIGLVSSKDQESKTLVTLLEEQGIKVTYHITSEEILTEHIESTNVNVWLLSVDDDHWHDNIDTLLDESDASIYFNEPGSILKEEHLEYWCRNLVNRLYEVSGLEKNQMDDKSILNKELAASETSPTRVESSKSTLKKKITIESDESILNLDSALDELQTTSMGLPTDIAAELVNVLEDITPQLDSAFNDHITVTQDTSEIILDKEFDFSEDIRESEININKNEENELTPENTLDLLDAAKIGHEENSRSSEQLSLSNNALGNNYYDSKNIDLNNSKNEHGIEEIDFSNLPTPILESAREDDLISVQSEYTLEEKEPESSGDNIALATTKEYQDAHDVKIQEHKDLEESISDFESKLSVEHLGSGTKTVREFLKNQEKEPFIEDEIKLEGIDVDFSLEDNEKPVLQGKANFDIEENDLLDSKFEVNHKLPLVNEELEHSGLYLEAEKETVFDRADFLKDEVIDIDINDEIESTNNEKLHSSLVVTDESLSKLSLESAEEIITGRAIFIEEENNDSSQEELYDSSLNDVLDDALENAELALENDNLNTGRVSFNIDETGFENASSAKETMEAEEFRDENEVIDDQNSQLDLNQEINFDLDGLKEEDLTSKQQNDSFSLTIEDESSNFLDQNIDIREEFSFEIPMLEDTATNIDFNQEDDGLALAPLTPCWIIGASLGGPAAVKRFLQNIPADINASFIIVQHIDENFLPVLADILTNNSHFEVKIASGSNSLTPGSVFLAPLKGKLTFLADGSMLVDHSQSWSAPYSPCIDDVIESISAVYADKCGAIIFSGMGQDGFQGAKKLDAVNGEVWAQSVETCANASMPQAVINAGLATVVATPEMLADRLMKKLSNA